MRGVIHAIAPDGTYGQILADDGQRYSYWTSEVRNGAAQPGQTVEFQLWQGQPVDIFLVVVPVSPQRPASPQPMAYRAAAMAHEYAERAPSSLARMMATLPPRDYWITLFTTPAGRISRRQFWLYGVLPIFVVSVLLGWIPLVGFVVSLALAWASVCICFKRFHDLGLPGWWSLVYIVPMLLASFLTTSWVFMGESGVLWLLAKILWAVSLAILIGQLIFVYLRVGEPGPNQYGPDPLAGA